MATLEDLGVSAFINIVSAFAFLLLFAVMRIQPINDRVYFPKWYISGGRTTPRRGSGGHGVGRFVNLNIWTYLTFLNWIPGALRMNQAEIIQHAGLDSAVYLRIYILGLKIFLPMTILALAFLIPVNVSGGTLFNLRKEIVSSDIDKLSISNVSPGSQRFWVHLLMEYLFTAWTWYVLYKEYDNVAFMRLHFLVSQHRRVDQFTLGRAMSLCKKKKSTSQIIVEIEIILSFKNSCEGSDGTVGVVGKVVVRNVPHVSGHSISESVEQFFKRNHPDHYLGHQAVYNANKFAKLVRQKERLQNWLDYNMLKFERHPGKRPTMKKGFLGLCGERVDSIDYYREKISELDKKIASEHQRVLKDPKAIMPVAFVTFDSRWGAAVCAQTQQSRNPTRWLTDWAPEPRDVYWRNLAIPFVSLSIRRLLISILLFALVFFYMIPIAFVQSLANLEGLEKVAPFLRRVIEMIPRTIGVSIPMKATFFMTYIMVDGWAGIASEILRLKPLVIYHLKNMFLVKTEKDREKAMDPGSIGLPETLPTLQLYFLLGLVYAVVTPLLLPFILVFFAFAFLVYRHQITNVYNQEYESAGAFWPHVHGRIIASLLISQLLLLGLLSTKKAANSTPLLIILPVLTIWFHKYCKSRFEPAFRKYPLEEAMEKDMMEQASEPNLNLKAYLADAYLHPIFHSTEDVEMGELRIDKGQSYMSSPTRSEISSSSPQYVYHYEIEP
ncbi:calcium permeable stress-gated cation channel 1 [Cocos nucifera]|uniref:Calcium permeable stress-gated cation channel 1 n=1 Tax=Cocos nucifera TaxID=13894 RepID=A0A8K0IE63_COCNU|nr:calcium permeable stress-gated cation channel 1 [Cocos nucifera]